MKIINFKTKKIIIQNNKLNLRELVVLAMREQISLAGADLRGVYLGKLCFYYTDFTKANLINTNFSFTDLFFVNFNGANLHGANFSGAKSKNVSYKNAKLQDGYMLHSSYEDTDFGGANTNGANFRGAKFKNVSYINI